MSRTILFNAQSLPSDIDLVVGIPRSGLFPANMISLLRNIPLADLDGFVAGRILAAGKTRRHSSFDRDVSSFRNVLVVDDSVFSGAALREARQTLSDAGVIANFIFCAIYAGAEAHPDVDIILEIVPTPRMFQWNVFHHALLAKSCVDLDRLILPPIRGHRKEGTTSDLTTVNPTCIPTRPVAHLVTAYPESRRADVETFLQNLDVEYDRLWMPDDGQDDLVGFKARTYQSTDAEIMLTWEDEAAARIARDAQRPVLSLKSQRVVRPAEARRFLEETRARDDFLQARAKSERRHRVMRRLRHISRKLGLPL